MSHHTEGFAGSRRRTRVLHIFLPDEVLWIRVSYNNHTQADLTTQAHGLHTFLTPFLQVQHLQHALQYNREEENYNCYQTFLDEPQETNKSHNKILHSLTWTNDEKYFYSLY